MRKILPELKLNKKVDKATSDFDHCATKHLETALRKRHLISGTPDLIKWRSEFTTLRATIPEARIKSVLKWYCAHIGEEFVPRICAARTFCKRFQSVEEAMKRSGVVPKLELSPHGRYVFKTIMAEFNWPCDHDKLAYCVQASVIAFRKFGKKLLAYANTHSTEIHLRGDTFTDASDQIIFIHKLVEDRDLLPGAECHFLTTMWFLQLNRRIQRWRDWDGSIERHVWGPRETPFKMWGYRLITDYGMTPRDWDQIIDAVLA